ncbi:MAG: hypothetical protein JWM68_2553, partial [Verrucomicrobiales bacterium]|nr:hypothetical protein [Verrucomicrobiales bacterium]
MSFLKLPVLWAVFVLFAILMLTGCGKKAKGLDTDANGYQCHQCKLKFYTDEQVWAE